MADLKTTYMGLPLANPLIVGSSSLTGTLDGVKLCASAGAGAVVLKSLFEEQILAEIGQLSKSADYAGYGEGLEYLQGYGAELGPRDYLQLVTDAKQAVSIPVIASLNCHSVDRWSDYAKKLEGAGADALELNVALMPTSSSESGEQIEQRYLQVFHEVKAKLSIPVAMKIGPYFSSLANFVDQLSHDRAEAPPFTVGWCGPAESRGKIIWEGVDALVLFNRFYQFDIDIDKFQLVAGNPYSTSDEAHTALRWISMLAGRIPCDIAATTGIHDGAGAIKQLLAGANAVQLCSAFYQQGPGVVRKMLEEIEAWMQKHNFSRLSDFRGKLSQVRSDHPENFERLQYIKVFVGID